MAKATYYQRGETLDYDNAGASTIEAGTILALSTRVGVAGCDIAAGETGTGHVEGCYWFDLASAASGASVQGTKIYIDSSQKAVTDGAGNLLAGFAAAPIAVGDTRVLVKLNAADSDLDTVVAVVNNLTSTVVTSALSAAQGKVLNDKIDALPGNGLLAADGAISVDVDDATIEVDDVTGKVQVKDGGVTAAKLAADVAGAGIALDAETNAVSVGVDDATIEVDDVSGKIKIKALPNQAASVASELTGLVTDFNALLTTLKTAGLMAPDSGGE